MRLGLLMATITAGTLAMGICTQPSTAQAAAQAPRGFSGHAKSSVPGCPYLAWRLARAADGTITGLADHSDLSGTSQVNGMAEPNGTFTMTLTSAMGKGPTGTVTGRRMSNGTVVADMKGQGCANMHLTMKPLTDINHWTNAGGGAG